MFYSPENDMLDINLFFDMVKEMSKFTGRSRPRVFFDAMKARGVRRVFRHIWMDMVKATFLDFLRRVKKFNKKIRSSSRSLFQILQRQLRLRRRVNSKRRLE